MKTIAYVRATNIYDDSRATKEILALAEAGYTVKVLAWDRNGKAKENCAKVFADCQERISCEFYTADAENGIGMRNLSKLLNWFRWVYKSLRGMKPLYAVHACNLDAGLSAYRYCKKTKTPLVYDIYDYYIDSHTIPSFAVSAVERMEISIINFAQITIICTDERKEQIEKATPKSILVLHNSPDMDAEEETELTIDYTYCGALGENRLLREILDAYNQHSDFKFTFAGYGGYSKQAKELAEKYDNFEFLGTIPYDRVLKIEAGAMAIAAIYEPSIRNHRLCAPNKFYEAMALGKPVIVCRGTGIDQFVEQNKTGIVINYSADEFYDALRYLKDNPSECYEMGRRARALYEQKYRWSLMREDLIAAYQSVR